MSMETGENTYGSIEGRTFVSRAVLRRIEAGNTANCAFEECGQPIKFSAKKRGNQVIANVYENGKWQDRYIYHVECHEALEKPYGEPFENEPLMTQQDHEGLTSSAN